MDLSSPKLRKILIFAAIFTVVVFIAIKIWRRSYYSYPNTSEDAQVPITAMTQAGAVVTVSAAGHNFKVGDIVLLKGTGLTITTTTGVMPTVPGTSGTPVIVASISTTVSFTFAGSFTGTFTPTGATAEAVGFGKMTDLKTALVACQDTYAREVINPPAAPATATGNRTDCIAKAVAPYTRGHCQWLPAEGQTTIPIPDDTAANAAAKTAYTTYQNDIKTIQLAYVSTANRAAAGTFAGIATTATASAIVSAARAADITGATQKYLATVCPGFYQPGDPAANPGDPSPGYKLWTAVSAASDALPQTAGSQKHFYASSTGGITDASVLSWAQYARTVTFVTGTGLTATTGLLTASITVGATTYTDKSGLTGGVASGENWRLAYANGPGTYPAPTWKTTA
jgi:hypothetical protein